MAVTIDGESFDYVLSFDWDGTKVGGTSGGAVYGVMSERSGLNLSNGPLHTGGARPTSNGSGDLRLCTNSSGTGRLALDVLQWNPNVTASSATCHLRFEDPGWSTGGGTLYLFYGNATAVQPARTASYGQDAVYHNSVKASCPLDEAGNFNAEDRTSNNNYGTSNGVGYTTGTIYRARTFSGSNQWLDYGTRISKTTSGTISFWMKPSAWGNASWRSSPSNGALAHAVGFRALYGGTFDCVVSNGTSYNLLTGHAWNSTNFPSASWTHVAMTWDGSDLRLFRNGVQAATMTQTVVCSGTNYTWCLGRPGVYNGHYYNGSADEFMVMTSALPVNDVTTRYNMINSQETFYTMGTPADAGGGSPSSTPVKFRHLYQLMTH